MIKKWWRDHELGKHPGDIAKKIALVLLEQNKRAAKLAGIFILQHELSDHLRVADLPLFAALYTGEHLVDDTSHSFAQKVLGKMLQRAQSKAEVSSTLVTWCLEGNAAQRRAACVAFTVVAPQADPKLAQTIFTVCSGVVWSPERFDQTAVGTLLRELARTTPVQVDAFFVRHARLMSRECARIAVDNFPSKRQRELLAHHKRATSLAP